jgi:hypothetical protein
MSRVSISLAAFVAAAMVAGSVASQARPPTMPSAPSTTNGARFDAYAGNDIRDFERNRADMTRQREEAAEADPERMALANRVAELVEEGKCAEARRMANEAGDRQMALRVRQTCRAR